MIKDTLYYDGACPICRAEIVKLKRHSKGKLHLVDIHELDEDPSLPSRDTLLARLHVHTSSGKWLTGLDANIRAWEHTPFRHLWRILGMPLIRPLAALGYEIWLKMRSRK
jgi:predicted DCC family thiol-disulfide oxidoreductase YuxK